MMRLLCMPTRPELSYYTGMYINCRDDNGRVGTIAWTEKPSVAMAGFFAACRTGYSTNWFGDPHFVHHCGGDLVMLSTGSLQKIEILGLYDVIRLVRYDLISCLLVLRRWHGIDWSSYSCTSRHSFLMT